MRTEFLKLGYFSRIELMHSMCGYVQDKQTGVTSKTETWVVKSINTHKQPCTSSETQHTVGQQTKPCLEGNQQARKIHL